MLLRATNREKFRRRPDTHNLNSMKNSILPVADSYATDLAFVQGAWRRIEAFRSSETDPVEPPTVTELEEALGEAVQSWWLHFSR